LKLAQGIVCGPFALAFSYEWARQIADQFDLSAIPKAPDWLLGASNIEGNIIPVIDLGLYFGVPSTFNLPDRRLLIGGLSDGSAEEALGLVFGGLPTQLQYEARPLTYASALPERLREVCSAEAVDAAGRGFLEMDVSRLTSALTDELSLL
jgi:chemotaxis signal transduction protein